MNHDTVQPTASVTNFETREENKKFTVYKVIVSAGGEKWFIFRRYNEFHKLYESLKKHVPTLSLKFPRKKLFGNNLDPHFVKTRREGLDEFIQKLMLCEKLLDLVEVREFLQLDKCRRVSNEPISVEDGEKVEEAQEVVEKNAVNLGSSERKHAKPSDFEFLKVIGKGSFGKVLLAKHKSEKKIYAVKVLQKKLIIKRNETRHIMSERNVLLKNLNHPFLVGLHYSFQTLDKLYFVLDYINGGELFFHLQRERRFEEARARFYSAEIASAIGYLHSHGIVYRDLKPENILLDSEGHVILTDFGLCKEGIQATDTTSTFCGTPEYLAPEVIKKEAYDRSVDWWCLGAVLYEMLYGLPPFYSRNTSEMYNNILNKPLNLRPSASEAARDLLSCLLQKDTSLRLGSGNGDFEDVRRHEFYKLIDWEDLLLKKIRPPYNPNVSGAMDLRNIDPEFTREPVPPSVGRSHQSGTFYSASVQEADDAFLGFSYAPPLEDIP